MQLEVQPQALTGQAPIVSRQAGMDTTLANIHNPLSNAVNVRRTSDDLVGRAVTDRTSIVAWLGYDTPGTRQVAFAGKAQAGAPGLVSFVEDLRAAHAGGQPPRVTVLAHSYGTLVTGLAARQGLATDAITLVGSPGVGAAHATERVEDVYRFGPDPSLHTFGAQPIPLDPRQHGHSDYYLLRTKGIESLTRILLGRVDEAAQ
jgi:pimeloyl-ACP methyl ester carboxylesterase